MYLSLLTNKVKSETCSFTAVEIVVCKWSICHGWALSVNSEKNAILFRIHKRHFKARVVT